MAIQPEIEPVDQQGVRTQSVPELEHIMFAVREEPLLNGPTQPSASRIAEVIARAPFVFDISCSPFCHCSCDSLATLM